MSAVAIQKLNRPTCIDIDTNALRHNYRAIKKLVAPSKVLAVLKANAYGHGLLDTALVFSQEGVDYIGVALVEEGITLRLGGIPTPILVFGGLIGEQIELYLRHNLDITASSIEKLEEIEKVASQLKLKARIHIKIDTGMGRIGVRPETAAALFSKAATLNNCELVGAYSHFACADELNNPVSSAQLQAFLACIPASLLALNKHIANSAAALTYPESRLDLVRPGLALYGISPLQPQDTAGVAAVNKHTVATSLPIQLQPALTLRSRVVYFKVVKKGSGVSYGHSWRAPCDSRIVTVPVGYGDGYPRCLSNIGEVLIRGQRFPIVGKICMDQFMVNIGNSEAYNGDEVVLIGKQGNQRISVEEVASKANTVPHEILTNLNLRAPRRFLS